MITARYSDLFSVVAETAATLTGLLFIAISLAPRRDRDSHEGVVQQVRAAAAFLAFVNALVVSLFGLIPDTNMAYSATIFGVIGVFFTAAGVRSLLGDRSLLRSLRGQLGLLAVLFLTFGFELEAGITLFIDPHSTSLLDRMSEILIASVLIGVARSWELVGHRQTGLLSSIAVLRGRDPKMPQNPLDATGEAGGGSEVG
jgi:hypothetical protein